MVSPTGCWVLTDAPRSRFRPCSRGVEARHYRTHLPSNWCTGCATRTPGITPALTWLDEHLAARGSTADAVVRDEHQRQGSGTVTVRNIITSMRLVSDVDWPELFERVSLVDRVLDETGSFHDMDFPTRNLYRSAIEELARGANCTELDVARAAVLAANQASRTHRHGGGRPSG